MPSPVIEYTTNRQQVWPPAASAMALTPSGTEWENSAWVQLAAAVPTACCLTGITCRPGTWAGVYAEVDIGVDPTGGASYAVVATFKVAYNGGVLVPTQNISTGYFRCPIPIDVIPAGASVGARFRKGNTDSSGSWLVAATYFAHPLDATFHVTTQPLQCLPAVTCATPASAWANSDWEELTTGLGADIYVADVILSVFDSGEWELDLGIGGAGSETVVATYGTYCWVDTWFQGGPYLGALPVLPHIPAGTRIALRARNSQASAVSMFPSVMYYEAPL